MLCKHTRFASKRSEDGFVTVKLLPYPGAQCLRWLGRGSNTASRGWVVVTLVHRLQALGAPPPGDADVIPCHFAAPSRCHALPQAGGSTLCWLGLCLVLPTGWWEAKYMPHDPCDVA